MMDNPNIDIVNEKLKQLYGVDTITGLPIWKIAWSEDMREKRFSAWDDYTTEGIFIRTVVEVREVKKCEYINSRWVLWRLVLVPEHQQQELCGAKISYEPMWTFENKHEDYLEPTLEAAQFVVDAVYAAMGKSSLAKYKDPDSNPEQAKENYENRLQRLEEDLFGNETKVGDALAYKTGVVNPYDSKKEN